MHTNGPIKKFVVEQTGSISRFYLDMESLTTGRITIVSGYGNFTTFFQAASPSLRKNLIDAADIEYMAERFKQMDGDQPTHLFQRFWAEVWPLFLEQLKADLNPELYYFGTNLDQHGHYRWILTGQYFKGGTIFFKDLPFHPEELAAPAGHAKGDVTYWWTAGYSVCRIEGSCKDTRPGTKSVFWLRGHYTPLELQEIILSNHLGKQIIEACPFKINW